MKTQMDMTLALPGWSQAISEIPSGGLERTRDASTEERTRMAQALGLAALDALKVTYRISSVAGGGWRLAGRLSASVVQACVITLEPVPELLDEAFDVEFWRDIDTSEGGEDKSVLQGPDVERLEGEVIPAGRIVVETLSSALNPYPRKESAELEWRDSTAGQSEKTNPFSVLARLKDKRS